MSEVYTQSTKVQYIPEIKRRGVGISRARTRLGQPTCLLLHGLNFSRQAGGVGLVGQLVGWLVGWLVLVGAYRYLAVSFYPDLFYLFIYLSIYFAIESGRTLRSGSSSSIHHQPRGGYD